MSLCPEFELRSRMTDGELWEHVFGSRPLDDVEPDPEDFPDFSAGLCYRCGDAILVDDFEEQAELLDARVELCSVCSDDLLPDVEEIA